MFNDSFGLECAVIHGYKTRTWRIGEIPRYKVGEVVAIKQSYRTLLYDENFEYRDKKGKIKPLKEHAGWNNKMFVDLGLMRHGVRIKQVKQARLQDITEDECLQEGIWATLHGLKLQYHVSGIYLARHPGVTASFKTARDAYFMLVNKINGWGLWPKNPIGYVYEFEYIELAVPDGKGVQAAAAADEQSAEEC